MPKPNKRTVLTAFIVVLIILIATLLRYYWQYLPPNDLRGLIYIGLFTAWGISVRRRILQVQVRRYMTAISVLMVFWVAVRSLKYLLPVGTHLGRYCWYSYYFPMLFIPLLMFLIALSLGKPDNYRLPNWGNCLLVVSSVLFVAVMTNDFHQLAFAFLKGVLFYSNNDYTHEFIYWLSMGWMVLCGLSALVVMSVKCHIPGNKKWLWLPFVPTIALILYFILYITAWDIIKPFAGDMTVVCCLFITAALESCIQCGLIQSNSHYWELFSAATKLSAQITDNNYTVRYASGDAQPVPVEMMREASAEPVLLTGGKRLHNMPVNGGHAVWIEDISRLLALREELKDIQDELNERNNLLRDQYEKEKERKSIEEQNRLYDLLQSSTQKQTDKISLLVREFNNSDDKKTILAKIAVLSSFIKRRKHLALSVFNSYSITEKELTVALSECANTLKLLSVQAVLNVNTGTAYLPGETVILAYDFFEDVLETALDGLRSVYVNISVVDNRLRISIRLFCSNDLTTLQKSYPSAEIYGEDEGEWLLVLPLSKGGGLA